MRWLALLLLGLGISACASIASTSVTFSEGGTKEGDRDDEDASGIVDGSAGSADAGIDRGTPPVIGALDGGCTCTATPGFGCCVRPATPTVVCTTQEDCVVPNALWVGCQTPDLVTKDSYCWNGSAQRAASLPGASCSGRAEACMRDADCLADSGPCSVRTCNGVTIGACTATGEPPACPL
jgi:hypothetical protein